MGPILRFACVVPFVVVIAGCAEAPTRGQPAPTTTAPPPAAPAASAPPRPEPASPREAAPREPAHALKGRISHYGDDFAGKTTASGEPFDPDALTMAHRTLPFGTRVRVTNVENGRSVEVVVNDRGPFVAGRIADLSRAAAHRIGMVADGVVDALIEVLARPR